MPSEPLRVYADTSVFGGPFDKQFAKPSVMFFEQVRLGRFSLVTSGLVRSEIVPVPPHVRALFEEAASAAEVADISGIAEELQQAYLSAGVVPPASEDDALHVAIATVAGCSVIVSWNFRHIVNFKRIPLYNAVNVLKGYGALRIHSPSEVIDYGE